MRQRIVIGIDTGVKTGFAVWDRKERRFLEIETLQIHQSFTKVQEYIKLFAANGVFIRFEDARQRTWVPWQKNERAERGRREGAGSIKRDAKIWEDFLTDIGADFEMVPPKNNTTKLKQPFFKQLTRWDKETNEHSRDAAMLVFEK